MCPRPAPCNRRWERSPCEACVLVLACVALLAPFLWAVPSRLLGARASLQVSIRNWVQSPKMVTAYTLHLVVTGSDNASRRNYCKP